MFQYGELGDTLYFWFASNDTSGSGDDGASAAADVRLAGATASDAPILSPSPALLSHANYSAGLYEVAVAATSGNGFAANNVYAVFSTLAVDSQNPSGFVGAFKLIPANEGFGVDLLSTTIATLASQTSFTLTAGSADDNAYNECLAIVTDASTRTQKAVGIISDYEGSSKTVTLKADPGIFTMAASDSIEIVARKDSMIETMTESYPTDGAEFTPAQGLYALTQMMSEFARSGTTITVKKRDASTTAFTITIDSASAPTSATQAS